MSYYVSQDILTAQLGPDILPAIHAGQVAPARSTSEGVPLFDLDAARQEIERKQNTDARVKELYANFVDACAVAYAGGEGAAVIPYSDAEAQDIIEMAGRSDEQVAFDIRQRGESHLKAQTAAAHVRQVLTDHPLDATIAAFANDLIGDDHYMWLVVAMAFRGEHLELEEDEFQAVLATANKSEAEFDTDWQGIGQALAKGAA